MKSSRADALRRSQQIFLLLLCFMNVHVDRLGRQSSEAYSYSLVQMKPSKRSRSVGLHCFYGLMGDITDVRKWTSCWMFLQRMLSKNSFTTCPECHWIFWLSRLFFFAMACFFVSHMWPVNACYFTVHLPYEFPSVELLIHLCSP